MTQFKKTFKKFRLQFPLQVMLLPGLIYMLIFCYIPIYGLLIAFKHYTVMDSFSSAEWVGLENFKIILNDPIFWDAVQNTLGISLLKLAIGFVIPIILAIMIYEVVNMKFKKVIQTITYLPHFLSWIILGGMLISWLSTNGLLNQILTSLNITHNHPNWLLDPDKYWLIAVLSDIWKSSGWGTILYLAAMARIDPNLYEAAKIDGANRLLQIRYITLPGIKNIISLNFLFTISGLLGSNLDQTLVLMNSQNRSKAEVINSYVYKMGVVQGDFSYATAVGLGVSVISLILLLIGNYVTKKLNDGQSIL
ncbi:ABC transporter permease [Facklamia miroungae]|uniref:Putative aldouronate transport system permease protein n=1 Tax=Facklamia miroungae TaxID=120956 RepID=A0A1G7UCE3_9LACT|nr:ABC transporter permease subunit [Facklamia miroungae]NKZ30054.1 sugar ABC transporter permease [Facklamia miroungae]SDG45127.1 putative aldouronate transport system permease protein [Facklamia miroungae]